MTASRRNAILEKQREAVDNWMKNDGEMMRHKNRKPIKTVLLLAGLLLMGYVIVTTASIVAYSDYDETRMADTAIVLGASIDGDEPSPVFRERINHAIDLFHEGYVDSIIMTGGIGEGAARSEADVACEYAIKQGVPEDKIFKEELSTTTAENLENAKPIMEQNGLKTALIVSDPLHMKRAMLIARDLGIEAYSSPTPTTRYQTWKSIIPFWAREEFFYIGHRIFRLFE